MADAVLESLNAFDMAKSNTSKRTACVGAEPHKSRYRLLECSSDACHDASEFKCAWRGRMTTCLETNLVSIYEFVRIPSDVSSPQRKMLTTAQKQFCRELAEQHQRPMRIHHAPARKFSTPLADLPNLKVLQNFVNHYSRTYLENHDRVDGLREWIHARTFTESEAMAQPFTFGWDLGPEGKPVVGNGSDEKPSIVAITTKALVLRMMLPPESFILHVGATYKMNYREYPVLVIGVWDRSRGFHLVALFVVSQETQPVDAAALLALQRIYFWIARQHLVVQHALADADQAQFNALRSVFGCNPRFGSLLWFFHGMERYTAQSRRFPRSWRLVLCTTCTICISREANWSFSECGATVCRNGLISLFS
ncbi:hypothetical protein PF003_g14936 [Phytophthora fragariae]|uniref:MULE transposase domain-containing protein n=1 Tax=Phytophthora fragariae TaxID=53985 RepID=A0A6A3F1J2_9STRA|nr:hypothetical protein PF003_g14936 [Phytophthora fragariae]KAE8938496.1 hypothetical protein PF009_g11632 [Phytophthora fragariae]